MWYDIIANDDIGYHIKYNSNGSINIVFITRCVALKAFKHRLTWIPIILWSDSCKNYIIYIFFDILAHAPAITMHDYIC